LSRKKKVSDIISKRYLLVSPEMNFSEINNYLRQKNVKRFPVVQDSKLVGLITETDIVQAARDFTRLHHFVQEIILVIFGIATVFFFFYFNPIW